MSEKLSFLAWFSWIFRLHQKLWHVMHYPAMNHWWNVCTNWVTFGGVIHEKPTKTGLKWLLPGLQSLLKVFKMKTTNGILKFVCTIFIKFLFFQQMIALQKLWKMLFISSEKLFSFSRYSIFCISVLPSFSTCRSLL